MPKSIIIKLK